jgi:hypothetical protein
VLERKHLESSRAARRRPSLWPCLPHLVVDLDQDRRHGNGLAISIRIEMACPRHLIHRILKQARLASKLAPKPRAAQHGPASASRLRLHDVRCLFCSYFCPLPRNRDVGGPQQPPRCPIGSPRPRPRRVGLPHHPQRLLESLRPTRSEIDLFRSFGFCLSRLAVGLGPGTPGHGRQGRLDWMGDRDGWNGTRELGN